MAKLTQEQINLLDRLYNLKGEDNILISEIDEQINDTKGQIQSSEEAKVSNSVKKTEKEGQLTIFLNQKQAFESAFQGFDNETFSALREIDVNLELGTMLTTIAERSPRYCEELRITIEELEEAIKAGEKEIQDLNERFAGYQNERSKAVDARNQLISLLEQSLSANDIERDSLTASFVKKILTIFGIFNDEEINKLTKLIMFPDEGLYDYDREYEERLANGLVGKVDEVKTEETTAVYEQATIEEPSVVEEPVVAEIEEQEEIITPVVVDDTEEEFTDEVKITDETVTDEVQVVEERPVADETITEEKVVEEPVAEPQNDNVVVTEPTGTEEHKDISYDEDSPTIILNLESLNKKEEPVVAEPIVSEPVAIPLAPVIEVPEITNKAENDFKEPVPALLQRLNMNDEELRSVNDPKLIEKIYDYLRNVDTEVAKLNMETLRSIDIELEGLKYRKGHMYIGDNDLVRKINYLRQKDISEKKIKQLIKNTNSGLRETGDEVEKRIEAVERLEGKLTDDNIYLIMKDTARYEENLEHLVQCGMELDEHDSRNHQVMLFDSLYIKEDTEILKRYLISILQSNGKYALSVFWKSPDELLRDIDNLVEADLENVIATSPSILSLKTEPILQRIKFCEENEIPVYENANRTELCEYIIDSNAFRKQIIQKYGLNTHVEMPEVVSHEEANQSLSEILNEFTGNGEYVDVLIGTLNDYYAKNQNVVTYEVDDRIKPLYEELLYSLKEKYGIEENGKFTYRVEDIFICNRKFERNLAIILNIMASKGITVAEFERELVLTTALYGIRCDAEDMRKVVGTCLGFNIPSTGGGLAR